MNITKCAIKDLSFSKHVLSGSYEPVSVLSIENTKVNESEIFFMEFTS